MSNILNLDKILCIFFGENIFTNLNNNEYNKTVDVRSAEEFNAIKLLQYNIPVITIEQHQLLHRHLYLAGIIVFYGLFKNKKYIRNKNTEKDSVTFGWLKTDNYTIFYFMKKFNYEGGNDLTKLIQ